MINSFNQRTEILWRQVWGLAALLAAIIFSWIAYGIYQPKILQKLEFVEMAGWLGIVQGLLTAVIEPFVGGLSDRLQRRLGSRLPMISVGVTLAGLIFVAVSLLMQQNLQGGIRWIVPVLMTVWVMAMIIFRGSAIALLRQFAPSGELAQANAVLVLVFGLVGTIAPLLNVLLKSVGTSITFILGAIALVVGAYILRSFTPTHTLDFSPLNHDTSFVAPKTLLILIFIVGLGAGFEVNLPLLIFPKVLQTFLPNTTPEIIASVILLVSAFTSIPLGELTAKLGANKTMLLGLGSTTALMGLTLLNDSAMPAVGLVLAFGVSFGLIFISTIPFALEKVDPNQAGLSTGLYFGGVAGATALSSILMKQPGIEPIAAFLLAEVAFFVVAAFILLVEKSKLGDCFK